MIDVNHLCPGCMKRWEDTKKPCPRCGFSWEESDSGDRELPPFTILAGRYLLGKKIGSGGFGITYLAMDLEKEKPAAVKEFFPNSLAEREGDSVKALPGEDGRYFREALRSFRKEAELLSRFSQVKGIVHYLDYIRENETAYLVMEYVEGINLMQKMRQMEKPFSEKKALELMYPILLAVDAMHKQNVLHRDISPENLILKPDGTLTLIDFGAAREYSLDEDDNLTVILKPGYAPDEQYHSGSRQGPWTDLYACCAVLYQMVSGILPQDAAGRRHKDELLPLDEIEGLEMTQSFARTIEKGMTIYATERYSSIGKLLADLDPDKKLTVPDSQTKETFAEKKSLQNKDEELAAALAAVQTYRKDIEGKGRKSEAETEGTDNKDKKKPVEEEEEYESTVKGIIIAAVIGAAIFAAVLIYSVYRGSLTETPYLVGMTEDTAIRTVDSELSEEAELTVYQEYNDDTEKGIIFDQDPEAGKRISKKGKITLYVSKGRAVQVPDTVSLDVEEARELLGPDFSVSVIFEENNGWENRQIISQSLAAGETVEEGSAIILTAAANDVTGTELSAAEELLSELGIETSVERQYSDEVEKDRVIDFSLDGENAQAALIVSDGPESVQVPDLRGLSEEEAQQAAADAGLTAVLRNDKLFYSEYSRGTVAYQHMEPGTEVDAGTRIYYDTSAGVPSRGSVTLEASTTSVTLKRGGDAVAVTFYTSANGGCICYAPAGIDAEMGTWYEGQPFKIYLSAGENAVSGMAQAYIYTGKMAQGTDVVVDYVNINCTVVD